MAKRLRKRMVELGLSKNAMDLTMFNEFQIKDMITADKKKWCKICFKGLKCKLHGFERMGKKQGKLHFEETINRAFMPPMRKGAFS